MLSKTVICLLLALFTISNAFEEENGVLNLTGEDFDSAIETFEHILVEFYAPWCGHCNRLAPEYEKVAQYLQEAGSKIRLAKVDATVHKELAEKHEVKGFPTLFMFTKGEKSAYTGGRTAPTILAWLKRKTEIASQAIEKLEDIEFAIEKLEFLVIFYGDELDRAFKMFWNVATRNMDVAFFHTTSQEIMQKYNPNGDAKISALRTFDERRVDFNEDFTESAIEQFILKNKHPRTMEYSNKVAKLIFGDLNPALFYIKGKGDSNEKAWNAVNGIIDQVRADDVFVTTCAFEDEACEKVIKYFGIKREHLPAIVLFKPATRTTRAERYLFEEKVNHENLVKFYEGVKAGTRSPLPKSDEIPDKNEDLVKVIVGRTFDDIVYDNDKDVLVFYNDIDCPECRELLEVFQGLAKLTLPIEDLILGKIDLDTNYVKGLNFKTCPQVYLYPRNKKSEPVVYTLEKDLKTIYEFFKDHLTVEFDQSLIKLDETLEAIQREAFEKEQAAEVSRKKMEELQAAQDAREAQAQQKPFNTEL